MVDIIQGVTVRVDGMNIIAKGQKGEVTKSLAKGVAVSVSGNSVEVSCKNGALKGTTESIIRSMIYGAANGYTQNFKLIYAHFPVTIETKGNDITIKNFLGEKEPRRTVLVGATKIQAKGQAVTVSGPDKEAVGQTVANLRSAMRIKEKDGRIFQDGIYNVESAE